MVIYQLLFNMTNVNHLEYLDEDDDVDPHVDDELIRIKYLWFNKIFPCYDTNKKRDIEKSK